jgi:hypothetical protein
VEANGNNFENIGDFPFMLNPSKHEGLFLSRNNEGYCLRKCQLVGMDDEILYTDDQVP